MATAARRASEAPARKPAASARQPSAPSPKAQPGVAAPRKRSRTSATVSAKGWVVIPKEIRERHGLKKGDRVGFVDIGGTISVVPIRPGSGRGMLKGGRPWAELLEEKRRELEEEERDLAPPRPR